VVSVRLFETLAHWDAIWVFSAGGLVLGLLHTLNRCFRSAFGDPLCLKLLCAPTLGLAWIAVTVAAVDYAYPHGLRMWQLVLEGLACVAFLLGPGSYLCEWTRKIRQLGHKVAKNP